MASAEGRPARIRRTTWSTASGKSRRNSVRRPASCRASTAQLAPSQLTGAISSTDTSPYWMKAAARQITSAASPPSPSALGRALSTSSIEKRCWMVSNSHDLARRWRKTLISTGPSPSVGASPLSGAATRRSRRSSALRSERVSSHSTTTSISISRAARALSALSSGLPDAARTTTTGSRTPTMQPAINTAFMPLPPRHSQSSGAPPSARSAGRQPQPIPSMTVGDRCPQTRAPRPAAAATSPRSSPHRPPARPHR